MAKQIDMKEGAEVVAEKAAETPETRRVAGWGRCLVLSLLLAVVTFGVFWPSLGSGLVYDARKEILEEGFITSSGNLPQVLSLQVLGTHLTLADRPGDLLYLMLIAVVSGRDPFGYHLGSNLLHALNAALLFILLLRLAKGEARTNGFSIQVAAAVVALGFALHPVTVETVAEVSYSSDLLVTLFSLAALLVATGFQAGNRANQIVAGVAATFCALVAVASKESGIAAALALVVYWLLFRRHEKREPWLIFLASALVATAIFLTARFLLAPASEEHVGYLGGSFSEVFLIQPKLWVFMMGKLVWPMGLSADYTLENVEGISTLGATVVLAWVILFQVGLTMKSKVGALGVALYWLGLLTVSNFVPLHRILADRFYYLPLAGVAMQVFALMLIVAGKSRAGFVVAVALLVAALVPMGWLTVMREDVFANEANLWSDTLRVSPFSAEAHNGLALMLAAVGRTDEAIAHYQKAVEIDPGYAAAHDNLGVALAGLGRTTEATKEYAEALRLSPGMARAHNNWGSLLFKEGRGTEAMGQFQEALELDPQLAGAHYNLGLALAQAIPDEAMTEYQKALALDPNYAEAHTNMGVLLMAQGKVVEAMAHYEAALKIDPSEMQARNDLGLALLQQGHAVEAIGEYRKVLELAPRMAEAHNNLGQALFQTGQVDEAIAEFQKTLEIRPGLPQVHNNLGVALFQRHEKTQAIAEFEEALRLNPEYGDAQRNLARVKTAK